MAGFILRRLLWTIPILWIVVTIVFFMMRSIGGDPFRHGKLVGLSNAGWVKYGDYQLPSIRRNQRKKYGLDLPWYQQYGNYLEGRRDPRPRAVALVSVHARHRHHQGDGAALVRARAARFRLGAAVRWRSHR